MLLVNLLAEFAVFIWLRRKINDILTGYLNVKIDY